MTQYVQEKVEKLEHPITAWALLGVILGLSIVYGLFINATISNVIAAKDMQSDIASLTSSVSGLESQYLAAKGSITSDFATAQGFIAPKSDTIYISRANVGSLSFNR